MVSLDRLKLDLKRANKRKADLERQIEELKQIETEKKFAGLGLSFDKLYQINPEYINWYSQRYGFVSPIYVNFVYRINELSDDEGVILAPVDNDDTAIYLYVPFEFLIEVNESEP